MCYCSYYTVVITQSLKQSFRCAHCSMAIKNNLCTGMPWMKWLSQNFLFTILWWSQYKPTETNYNHFLCVKHTCATSSVPEFYSLTS
jgi:hypothetical protein